MSDKIHAARFQMILSMVIFGTIGLFVRGVGMPSALIAMMRGYIGFLFLLIVIQIKRKKRPAQGVQPLSRKTLLLLVLSGAVMGFNWVLLFEAYRYTTVAVATLCYYMQPVIVTALAGLLLKEKVTVRKVLCVLTALVGMTFVSGIWQSGPAAGRSLTGILLGLGAACLYAGVVLLNLIIGPVEPLRKTGIQLLSAAAAVMPYVFLTVRLDDITLAPFSVGLLLFVCLIHTGIAYVLYFGSLQWLSAQTAAILSYIDPVVAILLSALLLKEPLGISGAVGAVLILGSAVISEL